MSSRRTLREAATSRTTLAVFGFLALSGQIPAFVDIYATPAYRILFLPPYLVTMLFYDSPFGLENLVYPVAALVEPVLGDGHLLWEAGRVLTFYLFALAVGWIAGAVRSRNRPRNPPPTDSDAAR